MFICIIFLFGEKEIFLSFFLKISSFTKFLIIFFYLIFKIFIIHKVNRSDYNNFTIIL